MVCCLCWLLGYGGLVLGIAQPVRAANEMVIIASTPGDIALAEAVLAEIAARGDTFSQWNCQGLALMEPGQTLEALVQSRQATVTLVLGVEGVAALTRTGFATRHPVIGGFFHDPSLFDISLDSFGRSGSNHKALVLPGNRLERDLHTLHQVSGSERIGVLLSADLVRRFPELEGKVTQIGASIGLTAVLVPVGEDLAEVIAGISKDLQGVVVGPLTHLPSDKKAELWKRLAELKVAGFAMSGAQELSQGAFASGVPNPYPILAHRLVDHLEAFAEGASLGQLPGYLPLREHLQLNGEVAKALGIELTLEKRILADVVWPGGEAHQPVYSTAEVLDMALSQNAELQALDWATKAAKHQQGIARSEWFPKLQLEGQYSKTDSDQPGIAAGLSPESQSTLGLSASQNLWNDDLNANQKIASWDWNRQSSEFHTAQNRTVRNTAFAYLNLCINQRLLEIEIENLKRNRANVQVAETRYRLGGVGRDEVLRWESLAAQQLGDVYSAEASVISTRSELLALLGTNSTEMAIQGKMLTSADTLFLSDEWDARLRADGKRLREDLLVFALQRSPEMAAQHWQAKISERKVLQAKRRFYLPKLRVNASLTDVLHQDFQPNEDGGFPGFSLAQDGVTWNVNVTASLSVFNGGQRFHQLAQSKASLMQAIHSSEAAALALEHRINSALASATASLPNVSLSATAADLSDQNLEIVKAKYEQGKASVLDMLQAQEQALTTSRQAAIAHFRHVANLFELQASISFFDWNVPPAERKAWLRMLESRHTEFTLD